MNSPDVQGGHQNAPALDPVCGMTVDPSRAAGRVDYSGKTYHFCSKGCVEKFRTDPERYLVGERGNQAAAISPALTIGGARFTCPMHPEVISDRPGACPKCGMALEPMVTSISDLSDAPNPELVEMTRRFWMAVICSYWR